MALGLMILAGGKSSRMGEDKALLPWNERSFVAHTIEKARAYGFTDIIVVTNRPEAFQDADATVTRDIYPHAGPLSGMHAGFAFGKEAFYFVMSCDMPLFDFAVVDRLRVYMEHEIYAAILPRCAGEYEPLAAIYHRRCAPIIESMLREGKERRVRALLQQVPCKMVEVDAGEGQFFNVNTPRELLIARAKAVNAARPNPIVSIAAEKSGVGKTTFIRALLPVLRTAGLKVAVLKSDGHDFVIDHEGKDTWHFAQAGAAAVGIVSYHKFALIQNDVAKRPLEEYAAKFEGVDLVLIESRSHGVFPVLEVFRTGISDHLITAEEDLAGIITDESGLPTAKPLLPLGNVEAVAAFILQLARR